jgi:branched-chain amino acid transport system substrate-binding protein
MNWLKRSALLAASTMAFAFGIQAAEAQVKIGFTLCTTGPAASLGIPEKNSIVLLPTEIGGKSVQYIVLDDASDTTSAVKNTRKLISEENVDVVIGSSISPNSLAMIDVIAEAGTPLITYGASKAMIMPMDAKRRWVFKLPQNDDLMSTAIVEHMQRRNVKKVAFIGFTDAYGDNWLKEFTKAVTDHSLNLVATERYGKTDASVTGQALKIMAANPDAVLIAGAGTPAALPQITLRERGYRGTIYQTLGVASPDFLRVCGKACEGTFLPVGPVLISEQLPDSNLSKGPGVAYKRAYEKLYGLGSLTTFGAFIWDTGLMLQKAIPEALKKAQPGTKEFRAAIRDALEGIKNLPISHGVMSPTPEDHSGYDRRARVIVEIADGKWKLASE